MGMTNEKIAELLHEIGAFLAMQNVPFKPRAYEKAAQAIEDAETPVAETYAKEGLQGILKIPGVGASIAEKIEELVKTGKLQYYEALKRREPVDLSSLRRVEGLGPKSIDTLYRKLGVKNLADLEAAAKNGKIRALEGFGQKSEEKILKGIGFLKASGGRVVLATAMPRVRAIEDYMQAVPGVDALIVAGSVRRRKETIGDIDILAVSKKPAPVMDAFIAMPDVVQVIAHGETKSSVKIRGGLNVDLRVVPAESYGAALNYFTGSKDHNVALRQLAIKKGYKLNEYGLFSVKTGAMIAGKTEEDIYKKLGMAYVEPELRENTGEIAAAARGKLPSIIQYGDLKGDLQVQTSWTDGTASIADMAAAARAIGLEYMVVTDHTKRLAMTHGLDERRIVEQMREIDALNKKLRGAFTVLKGTECDILKDGSLDLPDDILQQLDVVGVSVHSFFGMPEAEQTARVVRAMENPHVDIFFHPTGRIIGRRDAYPIDMDAIIRTAKRTGTVLEIDAYPDRSDMKDDYIRKCVEAGVPMAIDSDAHATAHFAFLEYGIAQARRGWASKGDIVNARPLKKMLQCLK